MSAASWFVVSWGTGAATCLFDTDSEAFAVRVATALAEAGREAIHVAEIPCDIPEGLAERMRERALRALKAEKGLAIAEAAGGEP